MLPTGRTVDALALPVLLQRPLGGVDLLAQLAHALAQPLGRLLRHGHAGFEITFDVLVRERVGDFRGQLFVVSDKAHLDELAIAYQLNLQIFLEALHQLLQNFVLGQAALRVGNIARGQS